MYYLNDNEKRDSMNETQLEILRKASDSEPVSVTIRRAPNIVQQQYKRENNYNQSTISHNILLAATIIQFLIIISACTAFAFSGYRICDSTVVKATLKGRYNFWNINLSFNVNSMKISLQLYEYQNEKTISC